MSDLFGTDYDGRKAVPIFEGVLMYFPKAIAAVAQVSYAGNQQHNPGEPLHWARGKSMDQYNTALRHLMDHRMGGGRTDPDTEGQEINNGWRMEHLDKDGVWHLAKAAWRVLAALQLAIEEQEAGPQPPPPAAKGDDFTVKCRCGKRTFSTRPGALPVTVVEQGATHSQVKCFGDPSVL